MSDECRHSIGDIYLNAIGERCLQCEIWGGQRNIDLGDCLGNCEDEEPEEGMSGVYIKGMEIPKDGAMIFAIRTDGMVEDVMGFFIGKAIPVPAHGKMIIRDGVVIERDGSTDVRDYGKVIT